MRCIQLQLGDIDCSVAVPEHLPVKQAITVALIKLGNAYPKMAKAHEAGNVNIIGHDKHASPVKRFIEKRFKVNDSSYG